MWLCLLATVLVLLPVILPVILFHMNPGPQPRILVAREGGGQRELVVVGATVPPVFPYTLPTQSPLVQGTLTNTCKT